MHCTLAIQWLARAILLSNLPLLRDVHQERGHKVQTSCLIQKGLDHSGMPEEATFAHLRIGKGDLAQPGFDFLGRLSFGMPFAIFSALVSPDLQVMRPLSLHHAVEQPLQDFGDGIKSMPGNLLNQRRRQAITILVCH